MGIAGYLGDEGRRSRSTGKERDAETGLDYFGVRYFSGAQGRFTSPAAPFADQQPGDPQSWNLYSYVRNNPLRYTDPTGRCLYPGADCFQYLIGGAKALANLPSDAATLLNRGIKTLTGSNIPDAPRFEGANYDQRAGMEAAGFAMPVTPLAEVGAARISTAISGAARVEATVAAVEGAAPKLLTAPKARGNLNTAEGPAKVMVDSKGNAMPLKPGETLTGSSEEPLFLPLESVV
jgi:RHS repeat-associated protein